MDSILTIIFFIIVAIVSSILKKKQPPDEDAWPLDRPPRDQDRSAPSSPKSGPESWEDELKRLLQGEPKKSSPKPQNQPPPIPTPASSPPPVPPAREPRVPSPSSMRGKMEAQRAQAAENAKRLQEIKTSASKRLRRSMEYLREASQLDDRAIQTIRKAANRIHVQVKKEPVNKTPVEIRTARRWLQSRETLRSAIVTSIILGPPKSSDLES